MDKKGKNVHGSESILSDEDLLGAGQKDDAFMDVGVGVGAGGKGKTKKCSASSSKKSKEVPISTKKFTKSDDQWAKDLPSAFERNDKEWYTYLSDAIKQGTFHVCWAVAIARCIQALFALRGIRVELSPQHLINNIKGKSNVTGHIIKYEELEHFLINEGLVLEEVCKFSGKIGETCPKECTRQTSGHSFYKIREFKMVTQNNVKEQEVLELVNKHPVVAIIDAYQSFFQYKSGIYKGRMMRKDERLGLHAVLVIGFGTTPEGVHYWIVQNSWGPGWGDNGNGMIIRECSRKDGESSILSVLSI